tara:strand:+ start:3002 stop:4105 length:1104 start_codon:yes stop_codon:yes gene_type:complete
MLGPKYFKTIEGGKIPLPVFFPDATRAVLRTLDSTDISNTKTPGILVNTFHLYMYLPIKTLQKYGGIREFMSWDGGIISDSGGFQVMSIAKKDNHKRAVTDDGVRFALTGQKKTLFSPEDSIAYQMKLKSDMVVVLDDFTDKKANKNVARDTVERTILWAKRSKIEFEKQCKKLKLSENERPYLLGVVQGGDHLDLRKECLERLVEIGFDGLGYGGWPIQDDGTFNYDVAKVIAEYAPKNYLLYGLGVGKPDEVRNLVRMGYTIFDCVLPTRDARHKRLYVYNANSIDEIDINEDKFYSYYTPNKEKYHEDTSPVSTACDCTLCTKYTRGYLAHLFKIGDSTAFRLATIHNLRFYSILMEKLKKESK